MARPANVQKSLDVLFAQIGKQVAQGVMEGIARSGLLQQLKKIRAARIASARAEKPIRKGGRRRKAVTCSVQGCREPARAKGKCSRHYQRDRYHGLKKVAVKRTPQNKRSSKLHASKKAAAST